MSSAILHIKDSYYFEVPRGLWRSNRESIGEFPEHYVRLDPDYQLWEARRQYEGLARMAGLADLPAENALLQQYEQWRGRSSNFAKPFDRFLEEAPSQAWFQRQMGLGKYGHQIKGEADAEYSSRSEGAALLRQAWASVKANAESVEQYIADAGQWPAEKIEAYNRELDGKMLIPQPFGQLRNNYQAESGFCISKFMILQLVVAAALLGVFTLLARRIRGGRVPHGRLWNLFETFLLFIRDRVARPAIGGHDADRFVPLLWTIFMFVLGCNLLGMLPWMGSPTASFSVTLALALVTFATVVIAGSLRFGVFGFWKNQVPALGLPWYLALPIVPMLFLIEVLGLFIKHGVLGFRLLANMVAGHIVLLAIMGLAVAAAASTSYPFVAIVSVVGATLISCLELFVAFLQAYVFTFLSALFIGAAVHHH
ncbi:MAG TPA: F0F1 ATP synthase subunit A [Lacipirellulaceae bacterium]|nr:F0F1 ATP synthase subunit A [Lacipirellulaceae bacterium]HMP06599.1 F0F1 ATP synthase subunit A [Lacipirellulaceae bacterium]